MITIAAGRDEHLERQRAGLRAGPPHDHVVVAMETGGPLPLARARNEGAARAEEAELLVFLDVDCIPGPALLDRYAAAARALPDALLCGPVAYLPPGEYGFAAGVPHPARPAPAGDERLRDGDHRLFWSLSFALTRATRARIGGFDAGYVGYGAEDTDFGQRARAAGVELVWVGGATAYHQHHGSQVPPVDHLEDIVRNGARFRERWGWWPMEGWLRRFAELGLVRHERQGDRWVVIRPAMG